MINDIYPSKPQFYYIMVGFKGSKLYRRVFMLHFFFIPRNYADICEMKFCCIDNLFCLFELRFYDPVNTV